MNISIYNNIINSEIYKNKSMSLGFRRWNLLPQKIRLNFDKAMFLKTGSINIHKESVSFFEEMSEEEFKQYILTHLK
ncbi:MAG: hypothetical protein BM557_01290 [Flavobacterium sp. MedPE-SWcel]|uniref:hypothetical protein n=1 Tax=uncultured Flavobacterium sp. TaxID=165435 RepID=UPI00091408BB|nr:hypothetical protein [uncultured Flavobacterium sp.]OIQ22041.1 MAG: hypothetical protein BM557_01290 [Flavobacterium sp. MedPE-SWcel]